MSELAIAALALSVVALVLSIASLIYSILRIDAWEDESR